MKSTPKTAPKKSAPYTRHAGMKITETDTGTFQADVITGKGKSLKRIRKRFESVEDARNFIDEQLADSLRLGELYEQLSHSQVEDAKKALVHLAEKSLDKVNLLEVAEFYSKHHAPDAGGWTVEQTLDHYLHEMEFPSDSETTPARPRTLADKQNRLASFIEIHGDKPIQSITETDVKEWLFSTGAEGRNLRNYKTQIQSLFNYAEENAPGEYLNTVAKFPFKKPKEIAPAETLAPKQVAKVMKELEGIDAKSTATMALCFFAGLRSDEVAAGGGKPGLDWSDIDLEERKIIVPAKVAKTGKKRDVKITDNLYAWLKRYEQESGKVAWSYNYFGKHRQTACEAVGVTWGNNLARHSFATYYAKLHGKHVAGEQLGHRGSVSMIEDHYLGKTVRKSVAESYFKILPKEAGKVIRMEATA